MNENSPTNPIAEAVRGYMRDRSTIFTTCLQALRNDKLSPEQIHEIEAVTSRAITSIDEKVKDLIGLDQWKADQVKAKMQLHPIYPPSITT